MQDTPITYDILSDVFKTTLSQMTSISKQNYKTPKMRKILDKASRLLLQNRIHENYYIRKILQSSIKQTTDSLSDN